MPHIVPCPAPRTQFAEGEVTPDGKQRRRRKPRVDITESGNPPDQQQMDTRQGLSMKVEEHDALRRKAHECPVPKPGGRIGALLGFSKEEQEVSEASDQQFEPRDESD